MVATSLQASLPFNYKNQDTHNSYLSYTRCTVGASGRRQWQSRPPPSCNGLFKKLWFISSTLGPLIEEEDRRSHQFGVDLGIQPGVADKVHNPSLSFLRRHVQFVCQHAVEETRNMGLEPGSGYKATDRVVGSVTVVSSDSPEMNWTGQGCIQWSWAPWCHGSTFSIVRSSYNS